MEGAQAAEDFADERPREDAPDERTAKLVADGARFYALIENPSWVVRRVTSFEYLELPSASVRTSLTVDGPSLKGQSNDSVVEIPLGLFAKALFGSFTVCDAAGCSLPLMASEYDSWVAVGILLYELHKQQLPLNRFSPAVIEKLYRIASRQDGDGIAQQLEWIGALDSVDELSVKEIFGSELYSIMLGLADLDIFVAALATFGTQFIPIVQVPRDRLDTPFVIKHSEVTHSPELSLYKRTGGLSSVFNLKKSYLLNPRGGTISIEGVNLGLPGSQHFRVQAPEGTVITQARMYDPETNAESGQNYLVHLTPRWATLYTKYSTMLGQQDVRLKLIPDARTTMLPAIAALLLSVFVLGTGTALHIFDLLGSRTIDPRLDKIAMQSSGAVVAIFLLLPSLYMLALVRRDEHGVATGLLRQPRYAITVASIVVVASAVPATFSMSSRILLGVWLLALVVATFVLGLISWHWYKIERLKGVASTQWNRDFARGGPDRDSSSG